MTIVAKFVWWLDDNFNHYPRITDFSAGTRVEWLCALNERLITGSNNTWLEVFHRPTDPRLDYCRCGQSWPCARRQKWEQRLKGTCTVSKPVLYVPAIGVAVGYVIGAWFVLRVITKGTKTR